MSNLKGLSLLEIADVLGHKQIQMTKRYAHLCVSHKQKLIENILIKYILSNLNFIYVFIW
jgi:hypothetical protein